MDTTMEREDDSAARVTRPLVDEPDKPADAELAALPAELASADEPTLPRIRRAIERRFSPRPSPRPQPRARPQPRVQPRQRRRYWRLAWRIVKTILLTAEFAAILVLASYAGLIKVLPAAPPRLSVAATGHSVVAQATSYCWFTPGRATCFDPGEQVTPTAKLSHVTLVKGESLHLTFAYPAPTRCAATAVPSSDAAAAPVSLGLLSRAAGSSTLASSRLAVTQAPGTYVVSIACSWTSRSTLRWLHGQGSSSYVLGVVITARH